MSEVETDQRAKAFELILNRIKNDERMGPADLPKLEDIHVVTTSNETLYFYRIGAVTGDQYGYGSSTVRAAGPAGGYGWGNKAIIANIEKDAAYITTMGFHRYFWDLGHYEALGLPLSDEYGFDGGSKQDFTRGATYWKPSRGCYHEIA